MKKRLINIYVLWALLLFVACTVAIFYFPFDPDYTAGELWDHYMHWQGGLALYPKITSNYFHVLNYTPFYFYLVKAFTLLGLAPLTAGRCIALVSSGLTLLTLYLWLRDSGLSRKMAIFVPALLALSFPFIYSNAQFHLEPTATLFTVVAFYFLHRSETQSRYLIGAALALGLACFTKQTQAIYFVTAALWSMRYHSKSSWIFLLSAAASSIGIMVFLQHFYGNNVWLHTVHYTIGSYALSQLARQLASYLLPWIIFAIIAFKEVCFEANRKNPAYWYFAASTVWLVASSRHGASSQYFTDWCIATLVYIGPKLTIYLKNNWKYLIATQIILASTVLVIIEICVIKQLDRDVQAFQTICPIIQSRANAQLIISENVAWPRMCGTNAAINPFIMSNLASLELWDQTPLLKNMADLTYPLIILPFDPAQNASRLTQERWTPEMLASMNQHYQINQKIGDYFLLVPRR